MRQQRHSRNVFLSTWNFCAQDNSWLCWIYYDELSFAMNKAAMRNWFISYYHWEHITESWVHSDDPSAGRALTRRTDSRAALSEKLITRVRKRVLEYKRRSKQSEMGSLLFCSKSKTKCVFYAWLTKQELRYRKHIASRASITTPWPLNLDQGSLWVTGNGTFG